MIITTTIITITISTIAIMLMTKIMIVNDY